MKRVLAIGALAAATVVAASAGGDARAGGTACPDSNAPNEIVVEGGSGQTAQLGKTFSGSLQVKLANTNGCALTGNLAGYDVDFDAPGSGAGGTFAGSGSREAVVGTDAQGVATAPSFVANFTAGSYTVDAHSDFGTVELYLSNTASGLAAAIVAGTGTPQEATVDSRYAQPLQVRIADANGNPVQGAVVTFSVVTGPTGAGASFLGGGQSTATTGSDGVATSLPLLANGTPGTFQAVASTDGLPTVATFSLDNHAAAETLAAADDPAQATTVDTRFDRPLTVRLLDASGQPLEGAPVTFALGAAGSAAAAAGATFVGGSSQATVTTDRNGRATSPRLLAGGTPGTFTATATAAGATAPVTYRLQSLPARLRAVGAAQHTAVGGRYRGRLTARVTDRHGRPVEGATVTFAVGKASNGATASFPDGTVQATATTGADGRAAAPALEANTVAGAFAAVAELPGGTSVRFALANRAGAPAAIAVGAADGQSTPASTPFPVRLAVTVTDADGNPVAGTRVVFAAPAAGPGGTFAGRRRGRLARVVTNAKGIAIAPPFVANGEAGGYAVTARAGGVRAAFALVNTGP